MLKNCAVSNGTCDIAKALLTAWHNCCDAFATFCFHTLSMEIFLSFHASNRHVRNSCNSFSFAPRQSGSGFVSTFACVYCDSSSNSDRSCDTSFHIYNDSLGESSTLTTVSKVLCGTIMNHTNEKEYAKFPPHCWLKTEQQTTQ